MAIGRENERACQSSYPYLLKACAFGAILRRQAVRAKRRGGEEIVAEIVALCGLAANGRVLKVGCGCARLARAFAGYLRPEGRYDRGLTATDTKT